MGENIPGGKNPSYPFSFMTKTHNEESRCTHGSLTEQLTFGCIDIILKLQKNNNRTNIWIQKSIELTSSWCCGSYRCSTVLHQLQWLNHTSASGCVHGALSMLSPLTASAPSSLGRDAAGSRDRCHFALSSVSSSLVFSPLRPPPSIPPIKKLALLSAASEGCHLSATSAVTLPAAARISGLT